jgi:hypothetical protein
LTISRGFPVAGSICRRRLVQKRRHTYLCRLASRLNDPAPSRFDRGDSLAACQGESRREAFRRMSRTKSDRTGSGQSSSTPEGPSSESGARTVGLRAVARPGLRFRPAG